MNNVTNLKIWLEQNAHKLSPKKLTHARQVWSFAFSHPDKKVIFDFKTETKYLNEHLNNKPRGEK